MKTISYYILKRYFEAREMDLERHYMVCLAKSIIIFEHVGVHKNTMRDGGSH